MANVSLKTDFQDGDKLFAQQLNNNFAAIVAALEAMNRIAIAQIDTTAGDIYFNKNKNVSVQMGLLKTKIKMNKLAVLNKNLIKREYKAKGVFKKGFEMERRTLSQTLDLRGLRAEEALDKTEAYLDKASLAGLSPVYIIHGHGTGALKQVIREYLSHSPYAAKFRAGEAAEGGDGVSIVDLA